MDKARRHELKMLKFRKRLKNYGIKEGTPGNYNCFRTTGNPCKCYMCTGPKYKRTKTKFNEEDN